MTTRPPTSAADLLPRDRAVLDTLAKLRVATTDQLYRLHFTGQHRQAGYRCLWRLSHWHLVRRLERRIGGVTPGSAAAIYSLDVVGQRLLSEPGPAGGTRQRSPWTPSPPYLRHAAMVSETYVRLVELTREHAAWRLDAYETEPACWRASAALSGGWLKPDAYLVLRGPGIEDHYFLEVDCATESPSALARKLTAYDTYWRSGAEQAAQGVFPLVLFLVPDPARCRQVTDLIERQAAKHQLFRVHAFSDFPLVLDDTTPLLKLRQ